MPRIQRVCLCGSMDFIEQMEQLAEFARRENYDVVVPEREESGLDWNGPIDAEMLATKRRFIDGHLTHIAASQLVLLANYPKNGIAGYVGANTLLEAGFGYALEKPVATLFELGAQGCKLEIDALSMGAISPIPALWSARLDRLNGVRG